MGMKRPRVMAMYHAGAPVTPSAATDQYIFAMARARPEPRLPARYAVVLGLALVAIFVARWMTPGASDIAAARNLGIAEGQVTARLLTLQPTLTVTGPGSQEGRP